MADVRSEDETNDSHHVMGDIGARYTAVARHRDCDLRAPVSRCQLHVPLGDTHHSVALHIRVRASNSDSLGIVGRRAVPEAGAAIKALVGSTRWIRTRDRSADGSVDSEDDQMTEHQNRHVFSKAADGL